MKKCIKTNLSNAERFVEDEAERITDVTGADGPGITVTNLRDNDHTQCCESTTFLQDQLMAGVERTKQSVKNVLKMRFV